MKIIQSGAPQPTAEPNRFKMDLSLLPVRGRFDNYLIFGNLGTPYLFRLIWGHLTYLD